MANQSKRALICGSMAFDTLMGFDGQFKNHILPDKVHMLNVAFTVPVLRKNFGGCAGNIAYNLQLLGGRPVPMATVGQDFAPYRERFEAMGIPLDHVIELNDQYTAQAYITADHDNNQITAFHPGAMFESHRNRVADAADIAMGIVAPDGVDAMVQHATDFKTAGIPFIFDPGQALTLFDGEALRRFIEQADFLIVNDYEAEMVKAQTGYSDDDIAARVDAYIVTLGGHGSRIRTNGSTIDIPVVKPEAIAEPTGCGDAYRAGVLFALLNDWDWPVVGRVASLMGSIKIAADAPQGHHFAPAEFAARYQQAFGEALPSTQ